MCEVELAVACYDSRYGFIYAKNYFSFQKQPITSSIVQQQEKEPIVLNATKKVSYSG